jgi:hypothetical protein
VPRTKTKINKSQKIREALESMGLDASPTEISRKMGEQGITVSPNMVSGIKIEMKKRHGGNGRGRRSNATVQSRPTVEDIYAVWELGRKIGMTKLRMIVGQMPE